MARISLILLISLAVLSTLALGTSVGLRNDRHKCNHNGAMVRCATQFDGVCAFFQTSRRSSQLSRMYSANGCIACSNDDVNYYEDGACKAKANEKIFCDAKLRPEACTREYNPVCSYSTDAKGKNTVVSTAGNACSACSNPAVSYFIQGECPTVKPVAPKPAVCDAKNRPQVCTAIYQPVCATLSKCAKGEKTCTQTFGSGCSACSNTNVISWVDGECPAPTPVPVIPKSAVCDAKNRPEVCTAIYQPVCATLSKCPKGEKTCTQTFGNGCSACSNTNVVSWVDGECPTPVVDAPKPTVCDAKNRPEICTMIYQAVCATLSKCPNGQKSCTQTFGNGCSACGNANVISWVDGECKN